MMFSVVLKALCRPFSRGNTFLLQRGEWRGPIHFRCGASSLRRWSSRWRSLKKSEQEQSTGISHFQCGVIEGKKRKHDCALHIFNYEERLLNDMSLGYHPPFLDGRQTHLQQPQQHHPTLLHRMLFAESSSTVPFLPLEANTANMKLNLCLYECINIYI